MSDLVDRDFDYHPPIPETAQIHEHVRLALKQVTVDILKACGMSGTEDRIPTRELSSFKTAMEEAMFWANAHIARNMSTVSDARREQERQASQ